jgi:acid phosphatase
VEEWFVGYQESSEYRKLGIGGLIGDLTQRMVEHTGNIPKEGQTSPLKMSLSGCHDTTIASTLTALGGFRVDTDKWPNFTSSIAFELFKADEATTTNSSSPSTNKPSTWFPSFFSLSTRSTPTTSRTPLTSLPPSQISLLENHYVRIRYNDKPIALPFCKPSGKHLEGDETFCTLKAFKEAADLVTPGDWKRECRSNLGRSAFEEEGGSAPPGVGVGG